MTSSNILFVTAPGAGHLNPTAALMQAVRRRGHRVSCLVIGCDAPPKDRESLDGIDIRIAPSTAAALGAPKDFAALATDDSRMKAFWEERYARDHEHRSQIDCVLADVKPDFAVIDPFPVTGPGITAVHAASIPYAFFWPSLLPVAPARIRAFRAGTDDAFGAYLRTHGIAWCDAAPSPRSPLLNLVPAMPDLLRDDAITDGITLVGPGGDPSRRDADALEEPVGGRPFVYVSLGTTVYWQPDVFRRIFAAAKRAGVAVLASVGALYDELASADPHVKVARYLPQLDVLARAAAFVTHGGYNSASEGLRAGTPMIVVPIALDQPLTAHYVELSGAGLAIPCADVAEENVAKALEAVTDPTGRHVEIARAISHKWSAHDSYGEAAQHVDEAIRRLR